MWPFHDVFACATGSVGRKERFFFFDKGPLRSQHGITETKLRSTLPREKTSGGDH